MPQDRVKSSDADSPLQGIPESPNILGESPPPWSATLQTKAIDPESYGLRLQENSSSAKRSESCEVNRVSSSPDMAPGRAKRPRLVIHNDPDGWSVERDWQLTTMRRSGMDWEDIQRAFPHQSINELALRCSSIAAGYNDDKLNQCAYWFQRLEDDLWARIGGKIRCSPGDVQNMVWDMGRFDLARRAAVVHLSTVERATDN